MRKRPRGLIYLVAIAGLLATLVAGTGILNAAPMGTATITAPAANAALTGSVEVMGTATVQNFQFYKLEFAMPNAGWAVIGDLKKTAVTDGMLGTWDTTKVPDGPYNLRLTVVDNTGNYIQATVAVMVANTGAPPAAAAEELPRRGCTACHVLLPQPPPGLPPGAFTLAWEAQFVAKELLGIDHPTVSPSGISIKPTDQTDPTPCLECHKPGTGAREMQGAGANMQLRNIVHPAHLFSETFLTEFRGNCFTCHNPGPEGEWYVLYQAVDVYETGMPKVIPIPGQHLPY